MNNGLVGGAGFHQARFGYKTVEELEIVVQKFAAANLPLESIWADIDHMDNFKVFTLDPETYPEKRVRALVDRLHSNDQKFVMILDPGTHYVPFYLGYKIYINIIINFSSVGKALKVHNFGFLVDDLAVYISLGLVSPILYHSRVYKEEFTDFDASRVWVFVSIICF